MCRGEQDAGGMLDHILGLPAHPLLVHGAVVLFPMAAIATVVLASRPAWWRRAAIPLMVVVAVVAVAVFLAKESGEKLEHRLARSPQIHEHAEWGDLLPVAAALVLLCAAVPALWAFWQGRQSQGDMGDVDRAVGPPRQLALAVLTVSAVVALGALVLTFQVGHSGAQAVWSDVHYVR
ncbi:hypothetical protein KEM60_02821 [Austwickia sp. TVS 96-490-7B]|nr:hypothetical protein [Austwickia sp. TVS 96-490-7B]